jgi:hypothetical protein
MSTSAIGAVLDALRAALVALPALAGVNVFSAPVSKEEAGLEYVFFGDGRVVEEAMGMGGERMETWTFEDCAMRVWANWQGDTESTIKAARDRVLAVSAAISTHINDTYINDLPMVEMTGGDLISDYDIESRSYFRPFTLTIQANTNP